jgi:hypothetical protein
MYDYFSTDGNYVESEQQAEEMVKCVFDGFYYPISECAFDNDGLVHIHRDNIEAFITSLVGNVESEELNNLKTNLKNQI